MALRAEPTATRAMSALVLFVYFVFQSLFFTERLIERGFGGTQAFDLAAADLVFHALGLGGA